MSQRFTPALASGNLVIDHGRHLTVQHGTVAVTGAITVGQLGEGALAVAGGSVAAGGTLTLGALAGSHGEVTISGGGTISASAAVIGDHGSGVLRIDAGAGAFGAPSLVLTGPCYVGRSTGGQGVINLVNGTLTPEDNGGSLIIGRGGSGLVIVGKQAGIFGGYDVGAHGEIRLEGGFLGGFFGTVESGGLIDGSGQIPTLGVANNGTIRADGTLRLNSGLQGEGPATISGAGLLEVGASATLDARNVSLSGQTVRFVGADGTLDVGHAFGATPIQGFAIGDAIRPGEIVTALAFNSSTDALTLLDGGSAVDTLHFAGSFAGAHFELRHDAGGAVIDLAANPASHWMS